MNLDLKDKKVFISGSTKGIGFETAKLFLEEGSTVIINGRTKESVDSALIKLNNKNVSGISADFLDNAQINELIKKIRYVKFDLIDNKFFNFQKKLFFFNFALNSFGLVLNLLFLISLFIMDNLRSMLKTVIDSKF